MKHHDLEGLAQALFEESGDALFLFDPDTHQMLDANSTAQRLSGFPLRELLHMSVPHLFRFEGPGGLQPLLQASRKTGVFHSQEGYALRTIKEGFWLPVHLTSARLHVKPKTLGLITVRDDRGEIEAHRQVKQMEAELRRVMASVSDCLWSGEINPSGQFVCRYFSPVVEKITGKPPEYFLDGIHRWWEMVHPDDQNRWAQSLARLRAGESSQEEYRLLLPGGAIRWVQDSVMVRREESGVMRLDGVLTDITKRKETEQNLKDKEARFQAFMDNSPAIAFIKDPDGRYLYYNRLFQKLFLSANQDLIGKTDEVLFPLEVVQVLHENDGLVMHSGRTIETVEALLMPDRSLRDWLVFKFPLPESSGRNLLGGVAVDITDRRHPSKEF
jgi:PAS domain S-box-containing protein